MYHANPLVQDFIDLAFDSNSDLTSPDSTPILHILDLLPLRDEVLALAIGDSDEAFQLAQFIDRYAVEADENHRANPAIMASIINYVNGNEDRAKMFFFVCMLADESNTLANLFQRIVEAGVSRNEIKQLIGQAVNP